MRIEFLTIYNLGVISGLSRYISLFLVYYFSEWFHLHLPSR